MQKKIAPLNIVPQTQKFYEKKLLGISRMHLICRQTPLKQNNYYDFINKYGPSMRYHNPHMKIDRTLEETYPVPKLNLYDQEQKLIEELDMVMFESTEDLVRKIEKVNSEQCRAKGIQTNLEGSETV